MSKTTSEKLTDLDISLSRGTVCRRGSIRDRFLGTSLVVRALTAGWPIVPSYGMTETASGVVALPLGQLATNGFMLRMAPRENRGMFVAAIASLPASWARIPAMA